MFWMIVFAIVSMVGSYLLAPRPKMKPASADEFKFTTAEQGRIVPVLIGSRLMKGPNVLWYGDFNVETKDDWMGHDLAYFYHFGILFGLSQANIDGVKQIHVGDRIIWPTLDDPLDEASDRTASATIDLRSLWGGEKREGGLQGVIDFLYGSSSQTPSSYLQGILGTNIPAMRGKSCALAKSFYIGTVPYPRAFSFLGKRTDRQHDGTIQWYPEKADINGDMNPAHIIREWLTSKIIGLGKSTDLIDESSFRLAADILFSEVFGLSYIIDHVSPEGIRDQITEVLKCIDGVLYQDMTTGRYTLELARHDYIEDELEVFDKYSIVRCEECFKASPGDVASQVVVYYVDRIWGNRCPAYEDDLAVMEMQGGDSIITEIEFPGISNETLARKVAAREQMHLAGMPTTLKIVGNRSMAHLNPNSVIKINYPNLKLDNAIFRVINVNKGNLVKGEVQLTLVEEIFDEVDPTFAEPPDSAWQLTINDPQDASIITIVDMPFWSVVNRVYGLTGALTLGSSTSLIAVGARKPTNDHSGYELMVRDTPTGDFYSQGLKSFTPTGTLKYELPLTTGDITIELENCSMLDLVDAGGVAFIGDECVGVVSVNYTTNTVTISRGVLDTLPSLHVVGTRIWFLEANGSFVDREYTSGSTPGMKLLSITPKGQLDATLASIHEASGLSGRQSRPYLPGNIRINSALFPDHFHGQPNITWRHRARDNAEQLARLIPFAENVNYGPEDGVTYTLQIYDEHNTLVRTMTGLIGTHYYYSAATERSDCGLGILEPLNTQLRFRLWSVREGVTSYQAFDSTIPRLP